MIMTETKSYKKTNTKTKTHRHIQRQKQSASKTQCMLYFSIGFKILYWLSSFGGQGGHGHGGHGHFRDEYFSGVNIFQG